jgi:hypothetical protein
VIATNTAILAGVFVYFAIGATLAAGADILNRQLTGRFDPMTIALFLAWPFTWLWQPAAATIFLFGAGIASVATALAWLVLHTA